jgi:hypothetical protein
MKFASIINCSSPSLSPIFLGSEHLAERIERESRVPRRRISVSGSVHVPDRVTEVAPVYSHGMHHSSSIQETSQLKAGHTEVLHQRASQHLESIVEKMLQVIDKKTRIVWKNIVVDLGMLLLFTIFKVLPIF